MEKHQFETLYPTINNFNKINLSEYSNNLLFNRFDSKYLIESKQIDELLPILASEYDILLTNGSIICTYLNYYFDTKSLQLYHQHHNKIANRYKIRFRQYLNTKDSFLEIKNKNNKGITLKKRIKVDELSDSLNMMQRDFINVELKNELGTTLEMTLMNQFDRLTLIHKTKNDKITFDFKVSFSKSNLENENKKIVDNLVIIEHKQEDKNLKTVFSEAIQKLSLKQLSFSKYCIGIALLNPLIKQNNFKSVLNKL